MNGAGEIGSAEAGTAENDLDQTDLIQLRLVQPGASEVRTGQIGFGHDRHLEVGIVEPGLAEFLNVGVTVIDGF